QPAPRAWLQVARGIDLGDATWLTPQRAWHWGIGLALLSVGLLVLHVVRHTVAGITDSSGEYLAYDFINYWAGAKLAVSGQAALAYDIDYFHTFEQSLVGHEAEFKIYGYPPIAMMLCSPLAALPFLPALLAWVILGSGLFCLLLSCTVAWTPASLVIIA